MNLQTTASRSALLLTCVRPFDEEVELDFTKTREQQEKALYGDALHWVMALTAKAKIERPIMLAVRAALEKYLPEKAEDETFREELLAHSNTAWDCLQSWMAGANVWGVKFKIQNWESPLARSVRPRPGPNRIPKFDEETHTYEIEKHEVAGTYDLLLRGYLGTRPLWVVVDFKSGDYEDFAAHPDGKTEQNLTLAYMTDADGVAILHTPRGGVPVVYASEVTRKELEKHRKTLHRQKLRIGDGSMTPGPHCRTCPAREDCPTQVGDLLVRTEKLSRGFPEVSALARNQEVDPGKFLEMSTGLLKLIDKARDELTENVRAGEVYENSKGQTYEIQHIEFDALSKASLERGLGKLRAAEEFDRLKALGATTHVAYDKLVAK